MQSKSPIHIPVICARAPNSKLPLLEKQRFFLPAHMKVADLDRMMRFKLKKEGLIWLYAGRPTTQRFCGFRLFGRGPKWRWSKPRPLGSMTIGFVFEEYGSEDGCLYLTYAETSQVGQALNLNYVY